jgi:hypothetical protein
MPGERELVRKLIGKRIIAAARRGELDPVRLRLMALRGLSVNEPSAAASRRADHRHQVAKAASAPAGSRLIPCSADHPANCLVRAEGAVISCGRRVGDDDALK